MIPVEICTEATLPMAMLSSLLPKSRGFTRLTSCGVTVMRVGKKRLPPVQRLAAKVSALLDIIGYVWIPAHSWASDLKGRASLGRGHPPLRVNLGPYTHSSAPFFQIQM